MARNNMNKTGKTINFDNIVIYKLDEISQKTKVPISEIVNRIVRQNILEETEYYRELAREYNLKMQNALFMKEQIEAKKQNRNI